MSLLMLGSGGTDCAGDEVVMAVSDVLYIEVGG